jgi:hypothetical protein
MRCYESLQEKGVPAFAASEVSAAVDALHEPEDESFEDVPNDRTVRDVPPFEEGLDVDDDEYLPLHAQTRRLGGAL